MPIYDVLKDLIAGTVGGVAGIVVGHPIDTVKVRLQVDTSYKGVLDCVAKTWRLEGPTSFYKGVVAPVLCAAPINAIIFVTYGGVMRYASKTQLKRSEDGGFVEELPTYYHGLAGLCAGFAQNPFGTPNELVKIKCQVHKEENIKSIPMARRLLKEGGLVKGLYQGWWLTAARETPAFGIYFYSFEYFRVKFYSLGFSKFWAVFCAGGIAGFNSWFFTHPIDVIKSLRQEQPIGTSLEKTRIPMIITAAYEKNGRSWSFAFRGFAPCLLRAYPVSAVTFVVYDALLNNLDKLLLPSHKMAQQKIPLE